MPSSLIIKLKSSTLFLIFKKLKDVIVHYSPLTYLNYKKDISFYSKFLQQGDLCFDIGANKGEKAKIFLALGAKVICVEPQSALKKEFDTKFKNTPNVIFVNKGLADQEGWGELALCETDNTLATLSSAWIQNSRFSKSHNWHSKEKIPLTTLDLLIKKYGVPKFCKIDVEGYEVNVIKGLSQSIPFIAFEFTKEELTNAKIVLAHLKKIGSIVINYTLGEKNQFIENSWLSPEEIISKLEKNKDPLLWGDIYVKFI
ncbi:MAG: FkbM family methyltransferase [Candidatus Margulisbacteria bacterium]|nr:FkbM family methyltransferase [Candidatus Margulisiibacteriota bacterium]